MNIAHQIIELKDLDVIYKWSEILQSFWAQPFQIWYPLMLFQKELKFLSFLSWYN